MVFFLRNKRFNVMLFWADYYLRWWRLPIEERACRKTDLGVGDYYLRNSGLPPSSQEVNILIRNFTNPRWTSNIRYFFYSFLKPLGGPPPPKPPPEPENASYGHGHEITSSRTVSLMIEPNESKRTFIKVGAKRPDLEFLF